MDIEKGISEIVGVFTDPIIVYPGGWEDTLPDWIRHAIRLERLIENMRALKEGKMTGTDAEACAYLYTLCLCGIPDHDWTRIYQYLVTKVYERHRGKDSGVAIPEDIRVDELNAQQTADLRRLKDSIYETRVKARHEKDRAERRERRKAKEAEEGEYRQAQLTFPFVK